MKIKTPLEHSLWPKNKEAVLDIATLWHNPKLVSINENVINSLPVGTIKAPLETNLTIEVSKDIHSLAHSVEYSIALNSINYMFWSLTETGEFKRYEEGTKVGANLMTDSFSKAWHNTDSPIQKARQGIPLTDNDVIAMFGDIPDISGRTRILNEVLTSPQLSILGEEFAKDAQNSSPFTTFHASQLAKYFPESYGDQVLKKAQLAVSSVWRNSLEHGFVSDCDLTAFADYQVPNVLRALGILNYNPELANKIDSYSLIPEHSQEENALRGSSILAVELLAKQQGVNVADVDYWLWSKRKEPKTPFHLTETTTY